MRFVVSLLLLGAVGCSVPQAAYLPKDLDRGELAVTYSRRTVTYRGPGGGLNTQSTTRPAVLQGQGDGRLKELDLKALRTAVACVPDAVGFVDAAQSLRTTGSVMSWIGWAAAIAGSAVVVYSLIRSDGRFVRPALSVASSGSLLTQTPYFLAPFAMIKQTDAVHAYQDQRLVMPACGVAPRLAPVVEPEPEVGPGMRPKAGDPGPGGPRF